MGFYDNYNFDGLKFFSQIKDKPGSSISEPYIDFLTVIKYLKARRQSISVAEIGIGYGATALQILKLLDADDVYYAFDFEKRLNDFADDLRARDFGITCEVVLAANSDKLWDSYNWNLSDLVLQMRERNEAGIFDAVYLVGAHAFMHDGLAVCLLKELVKDGGILVLDDVFFAFDSCEWGRTVGLERFTKKQMSDCQILRVRKLFLDNDPNFEAITQPDAYRGIFKKRSVTPKFDGR